MDLILSAIQGRLGNDPLDPFVAPDLDIVLVRGGVLDVVNFTFDGYGKNIALKSLTILREPKLITFIAKIHISFTNASGFFTIIDLSPEINLSALISLTARDIEISSTTEVKVDDQGIVHLYSFSSSTTANEITTDQQEFIDRMNELRNPLDAPIIEKILSVSFHRVIEAIVDAARTLFNEVNETEFNWYFPNSHFEGNTDGIEYK